MADTQFNYRDEQGRARTAKNSAAVPGQVGYESAALSPDRTRTSQGDAFNAFRGYVGPDGGSFGTNADRGGFETLAGVSADKLGDTSGYGAADWANINRQFGGIANRDQGSIDAGLKSDNPFLRRTAAAYSLGRGSEGLSDEDFAKFEAGGADALAPAPVDFSRAYAQSAAEEAAAPKAQAPADPWGRFEDPTAVSNVIKPGQDRLSPRTPPVQQPTADPFAPFMPNISPGQQVGQNPGVSFLPGGIQPTTFGGQEGQPAAPPPGVTFTPENIQPTTFGAQPPSAATAPLGGRGFGLGGQPAAAGGNPTGGMSRGFLRPMGGGLRRPSMQGFGKPLRPIRRPGGAALDTAPQTPQF